MVEVLVVLVQTCALLQLTDHRIQMSVVEGVDETSHSCHQKHSHQERHLRKRHNRTSPIDMDND